MDVTARFFKSLPAKTGTGRNGEPWVSQTIVVETIEQYPKKIAIDFLGEKHFNVISMLHPNEEIIVSYAVESREYNEKWYTNAKGFAIRQVNASAAPAPQAQAPAPKTAAEQVAEFNQPKVDHFSTTKQEDDLPF